MSTRSVRVIDAGYLHWDYVVRPTEWSPGMIIPNVADGVHLMTHANVNCYLIEDDHGVTLVDAGLPSMWPMLTQLLEERNRRPQDVKALVLTHGHFDHVGFALRAHRQWGIPVLV